ncbi:hypothetical protein OPQ81_008128 [Rhizoctonia solani]|nr:hypothetical protein OPQ81_008128 [Rhizoctonia solani]
MASTEGAFRMGKDHTGAADIVPSLANLGDQAIVSEPPLLANAFDIHVAEGSVQTGPTGMPTIYPIHELRAAPVPPNDPKSIPLRRASFPKVKSFKGFGNRENERHGNKEADYVPNHLQRIQEQARCIEHLERLLGERDMHLDDLERKIRQYQIQLREEESLKQELSSIRRHLRLGDEDEPWVIAKKFDEVNKRVEDIAVKFGELLCKADPLREFNTVDFLERLITHQEYEHQACIAPPYPIRPDEFIELGCQSMLIELLINTVLNRRLFNPEWDSRTNQLFYRMYASIRTKEAQVNAGRWRISTFKTIPNNLQGYYQTEAKRFCDGVLIPFFQTAYNADACFIAKEAVFPDIVSLLEEAYAWNYRTRSTVLMLDFEAVYYSPGGDSIATLPSWMRRKPSCRLPK